MKVTLTLTGLVMLLLSANPANAGKCTGSTPCTACHTCEYCKHCAVRGGTCGVCKPGRHLHVQASTQTKISPK